MTTTAQCFVLESVRKISRGEHLDTIEECCDCSVCVSSKDLEDKRWTGVLTVPHPLRMQHILSRRVSN